MQRHFTKKRKIRVIQYGLGYIGLETVRAILKKEALAIVGARIPIRAWREKIWGNC